MSTTLIDNEESIVGVKVFTLNDILLNGLWFFTEWSLNLIKATIIFDLSFSVG